MMVHNICLLLLLFALKSYAAVFETRTDAFIAQNEYQTKSKFAQDSQTLLYISNDSKLLLSKNFDILISPEIYYFDKFLIEPKTASLNYYGKDLSLTFGYFQMAKDGPDIIDPLDYQQPKNYIDPLHTGKLSLLGFKLEYSLNRYFTFDLAYVPQNRIPILPANSSPWYPRTNALPTQSDSYSIILPQDPDYVINNRERSAQDLKNNYIFKTKIITTFADIVLIMAETLSSAPDITPTLTGTLISATPVYTIQLDNPIALDVQWKKVKNYGLGGNVPIESMGLILKLYSNQEIDGSKQTWMTTFAVEKNFEALTVILESATQQITHRLDNSNLSTLANLYESAHAMGVRYAPNDRFSLLLGGLYDSKKGSYVATARPKYNITNDLYTELQIVDVGGKRQSLLSYFNRADSLSLKLGSSF